MNHREPPHPSAGTRKACHGLSLLLLSALALHGAHALPPSVSLRVVVSRCAEPIPYLPATGAPPLRFQEPATLPGAVRPPVITAEIPAATSGDVSPAPASIATPGTAVSSPETAPTVSDDQRPNDPTRRPAKAPSPILPDDARPTVRPEDFLPYFQIPGTARHAGDVTLMVPVPSATPAPGTLPPSSATYTQTPK